MTSRPDPSMRVSITLTPELNAKLTDISVMYARDLHVVKTRVEIIKTILTENIDKYLKGEKDVKQ